MSRLDELIKELCPNGVEYKSIKDTVSVNRGKRLTKSQLSDEYEYEVYHGSKDSILGKYNKYNAPANTTIVVNTGGIGGVKFLDKPFWCSDGSFWLGQSSRVNDKYIYYCLSGYEEYFASQKRIGGVPTIDRSVIESFIIPVPPLEVQREIVHILDSFTLLTAELTSKLTAELTARKKQYEYYRDELLKPQEKIPMVTLKEIATSIYRGNGIKRDQVTEDGVPCVRYGEIYTTYNTWFDECVSYTKKEYVSSPKYFEHGDILFAITGESVEDIAKSIAYMGYDKCLAGGDIVVMKHQQNPRYLAHVLNTSMAREQKSKGKVKSKVVHSNIPSIEQIRIPLPSLEVQKRYADVLDNFEQICNDLNIGLPAEIEARQKQYEFYRDLLLTFAENGATILTDRQTDRQTELSAIKLIQYVFGYVSIELGAIATVTKLAGYEFTKYVTYSDEGKIIALRGLNVKNGKIDLTDVKYIDKSDLTKLNRSKLCSGDMLFTYVGTIGQVAVINENDRYYLAPNVALIRADTQFVNPEYMRYFFQTNAFWDTQINRLLQSSSMKNIPMEKIRKFILQIPSIEEQNRIVEVLNRFDTLCNDLSAGLPAEIEARQKQYEYYRDKLLSFKELPK